MIMVLLATKGDYEICDNNGLNDDTPFSNFFFSFSTRTPCCAAYPEQTNRFIMRMKTNVIAGGSE